MIFFLDPRDQDVVRAKEAPGWMQRTSPWYVSLDRRGGHKRAGPGSGVPAIRPGRRQAPWTECRAPRFSLSGALAPVRAEQGVGVRNCDHVLDLGIRGERWRRASVSLEAR